MTTEWAHLPNAVHIDRVIASALANSAQWVSAWAAARDATRAEAWNAARDAVLAQGRYTEWAAAWAEARWAARDALLALIAYDDCAYMLESDPGELAILAAFGDHRAILLLPACKAFHSLKTIA